MTNLLNKVLERIDEINSQDLNLEVVNGEEVPKELIYGQRMTECLNQYWPNASEHLQIAVRAQHIKRWYIPRSDYPTGRAGYLKWRRELGLFHADLTEQIMADIGYEKSDIEQTGGIIRKEKIKSNEESQTLEDVACLVFLIYYFEPFAAKHQQDKIIRIVQKTWNKMSERGHEIALSLKLPDHLAELVKKALA